MADRLLCWTGQAWSDYLYWQTQDKKTLKRSPFEGNGKPKPLREADQNARQAPYF